MLLGRGFSFRLPPVTLVIPRAEWNIAVRPRVPVQSLVPPRRSSGAPSVNFMVWLVVASGLAQQPAGPPRGTDSVPAAHATEVPLPYAGAGLALPPDVQTAVPALPGGDAAPQRPRAVEYSDFYYLRLTIHRIASYATIPLFAVQYYLGEKLYRNPPGSQSTLQAHRLAAAAVYGLFGVNTVTGLWNLWDSRNDPAGRARRYIHAALNMAADAGFVASGLTGPSPRRIRLGGAPVNLSRHKTIAIASGSAALASYLMMLVWKN
jgi:hypothetical protein